MRRAATAALVLGLGCGPLVAVDADSTGDTGGQPGADDRGDDRPGTGPAPTGSPTAPDDDGDPDDEGPEGEVDDGWKPDFPGAPACSEAFIEDCYEAITFAGYETEVLLVAVHDLGGDGLPELVVIGEFWIAVHPGVVGGWGEAEQGPHALASPSAIAFGDFVDDTNPDLVAIQPPYQALFVEAGNGQNTFYLPTYVDTPGLPVQLRVGDIDLDGADEAIATLADGPLVVVHEFADASPDFEIIESPVWQSEALELGALQLGDSAVDLLVSGVSGDQILLGLAAYGDAVANQWEVRPFVAGAVGLTARNFDGDGAIDIAAASWSDTRALLHHWEPNGTFFVSAEVQLGDATLAAVGGRFGPSALGLVAIVDGTPTVADFATGLATPLAGPPIRGPIVAHDINDDGMDDIVAPAHDGLGVVAYLSHA